MANDYTTLASVKSSFFESTSYSGTTDYDAIISTYITTASRLIDREVGRWDGFFYPTTDGETRYFDGSGGTEQSIDEAVSISAVGVSSNGGVASSDYEAWPSTDYFELPYNHTANSRPIAALGVDQFNGGQDVFYQFPKSVKITGVFGWSASTPGPIGTAALIQTVRWFMRSKQGFMDLGATVAFGPIDLKGQLQLDPDVKALLYPYKLELMNA